MINRENLIKIGRAGGNTLNRKGWNFWKNTTLRKRIFGNSFFNAFAGGLTSKGGGGGGVIIACIFLLTGDRGVL